jgi:hypothetical protein
MGKIFCRSLVTHRDADTIGTMSDRMEMGSDKEQLLWQAFTFTYRIAKRNAFTAISIP